MRSFWVYLGHNAEVGESAAIQVQYSEKNEREGSLRLRLFGAHSQILHELPQPQHSNQTEVEVETGRKHWRSLAIAWMSSNLVDFKAIDLERPNTHQKHHDLAQSWARVQTIPNA
jgi:hypothetical protein